MRCLYSARVCAVDSREISRCSLRHRCTAQTSQLSRDPKVQRSAPAFRSRRLLLWRRTTSSRLKNCEPGKCDVQLPTEAMDAFKQSVDWSAPDAANRRIGLHEDGARSDSAIHSWEGTRPLEPTWTNIILTVVGETFTSLLSRSKALPVYLPELERYLLDYPRSDNQKVSNPSFIGRK